MLAIKICFGFKEDMKLLKERHVFQIQFSGISILNYFDQMWEKKIGLSGELIPFSGSHCRGPNASQVCWNWWRFRIPWVTI